MTPVAAIWRSVSGVSGESGSKGVALAMGEVRQRANPNTRAAAMLAFVLPPSSGVFPHVVDHLAVVRELACRMEGDFAAELGHLADRRDDRLRRWRAHAARFHMQRHAIGAFELIDD